MWTLFRLCCLISFSKSIFEYKYSIKPPILDDNNGVPFFENYGNVMLDNTRIRLVPSIQNQKGLIQTRYKSNFEWWEVLVDFHIFGQNRIGADGMAFWFTKSRGVLGTLFGRSTDWQGLSLVLDSYDNDHQRNNPMISAYISNGSFIYDHEKDGDHTESGNCQIDYRNSPYPSQIRIQYYENTLSVWYLHGHSRRNSSLVLSQPLIHGDDNFYGSSVICMRVKDVYLPKSGYFGISAMTGGFGDDHDIHSIITFSIKKNDLYPSKGKNIKDEKTKEYEKAIETLEQSQKEFLKKGGKVIEPFVDLEESNLQEDSYTQNLHAIHTTNALFSEQLQLIAKLVEEFRQYMIHHGSKKSTSEPEILFQEYENLKRQVIQKFDHIQEYIQQINLVESHLHKLKSDLHFISDQVHRTYVASSKSVGFYTLLFIMLIQTAFIILYLSNNTQQRHRYA